MQGFLSSGLAGGVAAGGLANRRGDFTFPQNLIQTPATLGEITQYAYGLAVWQKQALLGIFGTVQTVPKR